jgi:prepilin-type N-terminal cleavage/methylation domain-containing protein
MNRLRAILRKGTTNQVGLSLIEVLIAVVVFAIVATAIAFTVVAVLNVTKESQNREEAANLASQDIDLDRSISNVFNLLNDTYQTTVQGTVFTVQRQVEWVTDSSVTAKCGTGGGNLEYKRVNVAVSWAGQLGTTAPVHADTLLNPATRINNPTYGTILVSVTDGSGNGVSGITVNASPSAIPNGATALTTTPAVTDAEGCTYILTVTPGNYDVTISASGYRDVQQNLTSTDTISVIASTATPAPFQFDKAGTYTVNYPASTSIPNNLDTSWISTYGIYTTNPPVSSQALYPFSSGYQVIAGNYDDPALPNGGCKDVDPGTWAAGTALDGTVVSAGVRQPPVPATSPGGTGTASVVMGTFAISGITSSQYVTAVRVNGDAASGDPECADALVTYTFVKGSLTNFALPYGTWAIYTGSSLGAKTTRVNISKLSITGGGHGGTESSQSGTITIDPRLP